MSGQHLDRAYLDEIQAWSEQQAADPCTTRGHACRCPSPDVEALIERHRAEQAERERTFRVLFIRSVP